MAKMVKKHVKTEGRTVRKKGLSDLQQGARRCSPPFKILASSKAPFLTVVLEPIFALFSSVFLPVSSPCFALFKRNFPPCFLAVQGHCCTAYPSNIDTGHLLSKHWSITAHQWTGDQMPGLKSRPKNPRDHSCAIFLLLPYTVGGSKTITREAWAGKRTKVRHGGLQGNAPGIGRKPRLEGG